VIEDQVGRKIGGDCGNLVAYLPGEEDYPRIFFCAHMDTVEPADGVKVAFEEGVFRSMGETVLGADDKAGIAAILEVLQMLRESGTAHGPLEIIFTVAEEQGLLGSKNLDFSQLRSKFGYVLDCSGEPGTMIIGAPAQTRISIRVRGRAAHAGIDPEKGINAIQVAGKALAQLRLGRIDHETTANIGIIKGGIATNIIPDAVFLQGEVRSQVREKMETMIKEISETFSKVAASEGAKCDFWTEFLYPEFRLDPKSPVLELAAQAARRAGLPVRYETSGGGSDANIFNAAGLPAANLSIGMRQVHTVEEHLFLKDLVNVTRWLWEIINVGKQERETS
jgi:tripeptide aminopeptidase